MNHQKILVGIPVYDGRVDYLTLRGLCECASQHLYGSLAILAQCAGIQLARDIIADGFLRSDFEWLVFVDADIGFMSQDWQFLIEEGDNPHLAIGAYPRKGTNNELVRNGLGFCKIHRSIFTQIDAVKNEDGSPTVQQFMHQGKLVSDYFPSGCMGGNFFGEDTGFFTLCAMAGIKPRVETRVQLMHTGRYEYAHIDK